jgi:hypothetical protein
MSLDEECKIYIHGTELEQCFIQSSGLLRLMISNDPFVTSISIDIPNNIEYTNDTVDRIRKYTKHHYDTPEYTITKPLILDSLKLSGVSSWDIEFLNMEDKELVQVANLANYFDIPPLVELCCAKIGSKLRKIMIDHPNPDIHKKIIRDFWFGL